MTKATRLYGNDLKEWKSSPYEEVILRKIILGRELLGRLVRDEGMDDHNRVNEVAKAMKFNRGLLYELDYSDTDIAKKIKEII